LDVEKNESWVMLLVLFLYHLKGKTGKAGKASLAGNAKIRRPRQIGQGRLESWARLARQARQASRQAIGPGRLGNALYRLWDLCKFLGRNLLGASWDLPLAS
jgi:hypothetical protein